jgi:hypothetical protein
MAKLAGIERLLTNQAAPVPQHDMLFAALAAAQGEIKAAIADKENTHFNFKYADLDACWNACRAPLSENDLCIVQIPSVGESGAVVMRTILGHSSGQSISSTYSMHPDKGGPQALGSCMTYLRRYTLCAMVGISQEDDDANMATKDPSEYARITKIQMNEILVLANKLFGDREDEVLDRMLQKLFEGIAISDLPADTYDQVVGLLNNQAKREAAQTQKKAEKEADEPAAKK